MFLCTFGRTQLLNGCSDRDSVNFQRHKGLIWPRDSAHVRIDPSFDRFGK